MLDIISNTLKNNDYYVVLYNNKIYIYNYIEIVAFNSSLIIIRLPKETLKIKGQQMLIKKMVTRELLIEGDIESVKYE